MLFFHVFALHVTYLSGVLHLTLEVLHVNTGQVPYKQHALRFTSSLFQDFPVLMLQLSRLMSQGLVPFPARCWSHIPAIPSALAHLSPPPPKCPDEGR